MLSVARSSEKLKGIRGVVLTSIRQETDLLKSCDLGVNAYVVKPVELEKSIEAFEQLGIFWEIINEPPPSV